MKRLPILLLTLVLVSACATMPRIPANPANPMQTIAVLPLVNATNDVEGPQTVREKLIPVVESHRYSVMPLEEVDRRLRNRLGITLGGQLQEATPQQLGEVLQVDGLLYGTLLDFGETTTGVYNVRKVRATFQLVEAHSGRTIWENGLGVRSELRMSDDAGRAVDALADIKDAKDGKEVPWVTIDSHTSNQNFETTLAISLVTKLATKAAGLHLARETGEMIKRVTDSFPPGPGVVIAFETPGCPESSPE